MRTIVCGRWNKHSSNREETSKLWSVRNIFDAGKATYEDLEEAQDEVVLLLLKELESSGVDMLGDGGIRWDSIYDVTRMISNCKGFAQLTRIPETNHFHRQPVWSEKPEKRLPFFLDSPSLKFDLRFAVRHTNRPVVMCLPGPYSTALQTQNVTEIGVTDLTFNYAERFNYEARNLIENGAEMVRFEEPQILSHPEHWKLFKIAMEILTKGLDKTKVGLATWYGDVCSLPEYFNLPFGIFFVDLVQGKKTLDVFGDFPADKELVAGVFDAQETYEEKDEEVASVLHEVLRYVSEDRVLLSTTTDLHFLPWDEALAKVKRLTIFSQNFSKGSI